MDQKTLVRNIAKFHENYKNAILNEKINNKDKYLSNSKDSLFFIFSYSFYQGRKDTISSEFEKRAVKTIDSLLEKNDILSIKAQRIRNKKVLIEEYKELYDKLKENRVNKESDRLMVIDLINLIQSLDQKNLVSYLIKKIETSIKEAYKILDDVHSIGHKIASFILRDLVCIYELEKYIKANDYYYLQPIDTWVHQISRKIGLVHKDKIYSAESKDIVNKCFEFEVNPIHYNQGAWYIGTHSLEILLSNIDSVK
jgi:hypothetical protein